MVEQEATKPLPFGDIWNEYCGRYSVVFNRDFYAEIKKYEDQILRNRY